MNSLQNKTVFSLQIFFSKYLLLLFIMFLDVGNAKAQQSSQSRIIGYWKGDLQTVYNGINMTFIIYYAVLADGSAKGVTLIIGNGKKTIVTSSYKHWFEGNYYCTQSSEKSDVGKSTLDWISDDEGYQTWINGELKGTKAHFVRVKKEEFEKYFNNSGLLYDIEMPKLKQNQSNNNIIGYWKYDSEFILKGNPFLVDKYGQRVYDPDIQISMVGYRHITAEGWYQQIEHFRSDNSEEATNTKEKYWFEGKYFCTSGKKDVNRCALDFLNNDEFYAKYISGFRTRNNTTATDHYIRVSKEEFEKYAAHPDRIREVPFGAQRHIPPIPPIPPYEDPKFDCPTCHGQCVYECYICFGRGKRKRVVEEREYDSYEKRYKTHRKEVWVDCSNSDCHSGKVKCTDTRCQCNIRR